MTQIEICSRCGAKFEPSHAVLMCARCLAQVDRLLGLEKGELSSPKKGELSSPKKGELSSPKKGEQGSPCFDCGQPLELADLAVGVCARCFSGRV
jgi:NMD protein affecting ribosome stability and mRNA decay